MLKWASLYLLIVMMHTFINSPWQIGTLKLPHRLIQGPLAGYSCAPFRVLFNEFTPPAYCVTEMSSAWDIIHKHAPQSRYVYRDPQEQFLAYQISGNDPEILASAALILQNKGANIIDINCGCPKSKIRKKGAGSALLEDPQKLIAIIAKVRAAINIPLTVKIRLQSLAQDIPLAQNIAEAGADALIVHGRRWIDDYDVACNFQQIALIKQQVSIPVIANGDIHNAADLEHAFRQTGCDAYMIARGGSGRPWLYQELLQQHTALISQAEKILLFMRHLEGLAALEDEYKAILQSKSLIRYYFKNQLTKEQLNGFYQLRSLSQILDFLMSETQFAN
jgi:nifR3 family TIM-barrel protein